MIGRVTVNLDVVEALLFFWQSIKERQKISDLFIMDVTAMPGLKFTYDEEFNAESVRRALSAITNREAFSSKNRKEGRFYSNNLWMLEDLGYTGRMVQPLKKLNLEYLAGELDAGRVEERFHELEVLFSPLHVDEYVIRDNKLIINFFAVKPGDDDDLYVGGKELVVFVTEKLQELLATA